MEIKHSLWILALALLLTSCANTKATSKTLTIGRFEKDSAIKNKIDRSISLYEMGEVDAAIANLTNLVDDAQYSSALDQAYELLVEWLLQVKRRSEAKRIASYFLSHHPKNPTGNKLIALFSPKETPPLATVQVEVVPELAPAELKPAGEEPIQAQPKVSRRVGIILPLSGPYEPFGSRVLSAVKLALKTNDLVDHAETKFLTKDNIQFIVADSQGDPKLAQIAAEKLVQTHGVELIIGDIMSEPSLGVAIACERLGVPQLSLARNSQLASHGKNIFIFNSSREQQIASLVKHAVLDMGHKNFGILFPKHTYGITMAKTFFDEVKTQGGNITGMDSYEPDETTFTSMAKNLVGMLHLDQRTEFVSCLETARQEKDYSLQNAESSCKKQLKPVIDFDAIFIPDFSPISLVIPALIREDISITNNPIARKNFALATKTENPKYVQLLGPNSWHDANIIAKLGNSVDGAYFVDSFDFDNDSELKGFVTEFQSFNLGAPTEIEVFAHDAALFSMLLLAKPSENKHLQDRIANFKQKVGLLPRISFDKNQNLIVPVTGFEITSGSSRVVSRENFN